MLRFVHKVQVSLSNCCSYWQCRIWCQHVNGNACSSCVSQ